MKHSVQSPLLGRDIRKLVFAAGLACVAVVPGHAQTHLQIPAGTTGTLTSGGAQPPKTKKILADALGPKTRATLQAAMDSMGD
jgi:hypothetical protein